MLMSALALWMLWLAVSFGLDAVAARKIGGEGSSRGSAVVVQIFCASSPPRGNEQWWGPAIFGTAFLLFAAMGYATYRRPA